MLNETDRKRVFAIIIATQCMGMITTALFQNGFYLNYFSRLGVSSSQIALLLALPFAASVMLLMPFAFWSDRFGKRRMALIGQALLICSLAMMMLAGGWGGLRMVAAALLVYTVGGSLQAAGWFALLNPIVPPGVRGRFFGRLRVAFQLASIGFTLLVTGVLGRAHSLSAFEGLLGVVLVLSVLRYFTYARIPELEDAGGEKDHRHSFFDALRSVFRVPGYLPYVGYVFLMTLFTAAVPVTFGLMEKDVFAFSPSRITLMGALFLLGGVLGCWQGGHVVDRHGTRFGFLVSQLFFAGAILAMLLRHWAPWPLPAHVGGCTLAFGWIGGLAGVASTAEMLALIPERNKSFSTALATTLYNAGVALAGLFVSRAIEWRALAARWTAFSVEYTRYDTLLLTFVVMLLVMLFAVGLVPNIDMPGRGSMNGPAAEGLERGGVRGG